ncbi:MAG: SRPBCC family protein [Tabrizicola sp.]|uniref:SRPBCC family protein n=1 Tax=Tabrizicola sp. TaxID=2005166 RepID=UPI0027337A5E|nr:SRPBCC family protein [Tabrizicola sp.]MDP3262331.1 SRPBCC family protein [Tabrizicola sp.]MDP3647922.1 SRPBCC family protein [Paracoccaceae bacterium]MDZ4069934.1 SRPBCC family protein [Tabrizicola sp.]
MRLTAKTDIEVPLAEVYRYITDFNAWEEAATRRGAEVSRSGAKADAVGAGWRVRFAFRGKARNVLVKVARLVPGEVAAFVIDSPSIEGASQLEVTPLSPRRTRVRVVLDVKPKTLAARVFISTLRLSKARVDRRFEGRVAQLGAALTDRYQRSQLAGAKG